jgi:hypothetical protein
MAWWIFCPSCHMTGSCAFILPQCSHLNYILHSLYLCSNEETAQAAIFGMGLVGAGTNNSRIAGLLRTLATFYKNEPNHLFVVRIAQGILHMGKGLVTVNPIHSDRSLLSPVLLSGVLSTCLLFLDVKSSLHSSKWHILLYSLAISMHPRFIITVDEEGTLVPAEVRVGGAVETVGQAGRPKTITGFQTHTTPVLMGVKDRAGTFSIAAVLHCFVLGLTCVSHYCRAGRRFLPTTHNHTRERRCPAAQPRGEGQEEACRLCSGCRKEIGPHFRNPLLEKFQVAGSMHASCTASSVLAR